MPRAKTPARATTLKDLARQLGVSPATVSNAYNRPDQLSEELRVRVLAAARELGYPGPNPLASNLRRGRAGALGVLYGDRLTYAFADPAAALFLGGVAAAAEREGLNLLLLPAPGDPQAVTTAAVDGFIVYCLAEGSPALGAALGRSQPCVLVDQLGDHGRPSVTIDDRGGARQAAEHLLAHGHHRLGVLSLELALPRRHGPAPAGRAAGPTFRPPAERLAGYREAAGARGLDWAQVPVMEILENTLDEGEHLARDLLTRPEPPTALLCMSDQLALGALRAAHHLGVRVPQDLSVVGFDDIPSAAELGLTTVRQPTARKGQLAGELLLALLAGQPTHSPAPLPAELLVRGSSGPAPTTESF